MWRNCIRVISGSTHTHVLTRYFRPFFQHRLVQWDRAAGWAPLCWSRRELSSKEELRLKEWKKNRLSQKFGDKRGGKNCKNVAGASSVPGSSCGMRQRLIKRAGLWRERPVVGLAGGHMKVGTFSHSCQQFLMWTSVLIGRAGARL